MLNGLYILLEGLNDDRFFKRLIIPIFNYYYDWVETYLYANKKLKTVNNFISSIDRMGCDYIFIGDINSCPCVTKKKENLNKKFERINKSKIIVIIKEIESWYLAGLDKGNSHRLNIKYLSNTDEITKEDFKMITSNCKFKSNIDFLQEIMSIYSINIAKIKNKSFFYFYEKYINLNDN